jgi:hypothetical protein
VKKQKLLMAALALLIGAASAAGPKLSATDLQAEKITWLRHR